MLCYTVGDPQNHWTDHGAQDEHHSIQPVQPAPRSSAYEWIFSSQHSSVIIFVIVLWTRHLRYRYGVPLFILCIFLSVSLFLSNCSGIFCCLTASYFCEFMFLLTLI